MASSIAVILGESLRHRGRNGFKVGGAKHFFDQAKYILVLLIKCTKCMHASVIKRNKMPCN